MTIKELASEILDFLKTVCSAMIKNKKTLLQIVILLVGVVICIWLFYFLDSAAKGFVFYSDNIQRIIFIVAFCVSVGLVSPILNWLDKQKWAKK